MSIPELSVKRPVTTVMIFTAIVLLGLISWTKLPQELFPSISYPQITIATSYENAAPEEIESLVTKIVEETVGTVNNVKRIKSVSKEGLSLVIIDFTWGTNMDFAALGVREKIDLIKERLPRDALDPVVMKYNPFELPIMNLAITAPGVPSVELREITRRYIKEAVEKIDGVASAMISGGDIKEILVEIDQARLLASQISIVDVVESLKKSNLNYPAGTIKESIYEYLIRTMGEFQTTEEIKDTPTALEIPQEEKDGKEGKERRLVYLRDISRVCESIKEKTSISRYNGEDNISLIIRKQSGTNTSLVARAIRKEIEKLKKEKLPPEVNIKITYDQSTYITESISNLCNDAISGGILAFFVLLFFLKDTLSSLAITLSIPISLMATFCLMFFGKININLMSLGGLALGVGMLVDNSIVVIENIFRHRQMGKVQKQAASEGAAEVFAPILGSTLTTVAVFLPFAFVVGLAGQIFKQLSLTITFSLLVSILVAISLIPVVISSSKRKKVRQSLTRSPQITPKFPALLSATLKTKEINIFIVLIIFVISVWFLTGHERRFLPECDQRQFIIKFELAPGSRLEETDRMVKKIEKLLLKLAEVKDVTVNIGSSEEKGAAEETLLKTLGSHQTQIMVNLKKLSRKDAIARSTKEVITFLKKEVEKDAQLQEAQIEYIAQETSLGQAVEEASPVAVEIRGPLLSELAEIGSQIKERLKEIDGLYSIKTSLIPPTPETKLYILKDKASLHALSVRDIAVTAQVALKGFVATQFKVKGEEKDIDIRVQLRPEDRANLKNLKRILIRSPLRTMVPLSEIANLLKGTGPTEIQRVNQQRAIMVTANILNRPLREVLKKVNGVVEDVSQRLPQAKDYSIEITGEQKQMQESYKSLAFALTFAIIFVYMIMAAEFESLWQPFIVMFTVPLSLIGVALILFLTRTPLSVVAYLGIIMLGGIAVNNGIILIEFINGLRKKGVGIKEAAIEAACARLRPILMTSLTTILGMLPLSLGIGEGSELRAPLARTVMGGLTSATFLTLLIIPAIYVVVSEFMEKFKRKPVLVKEEIEVPIVSWKEKVLEEPLPPREEVAKKPVETKPKKAAAPEEKTPKEPEEPLLYGTPYVIEEIPEEAKKVTPAAEKAEEVREEPAPPPKEKAVKGKAEEVKEILPAPPAKEEKKLNPRQIELLEKLKTLGKITRAKYAKMFDVSVPTAARDLKELAEKGLIIGKGPLGPGRWYELK